MGQIIINGRNSVNISNVTGSSITITNGKIIVDGKDITPNAKEIYISIQGDMENIEVDNCNTIDVTGNVSKLRSGSGDVTVTGNVSENVEAGSGNIKVGGNIGGNVKTGSGNVKASSITGDAKTGSGNIVTK